MDETAFQRHVIALAKLKGWLVFAMKDSREQWWGTDTGFPDLTLSRRARVIFAELKLAGERPRPDQECWANNLKQSDAEYYLWRPSDEALIVRTLA
jgi:hypothetical protein